MRLLDDFFPYVGHFRIQYLQLFIHVFLFLYCIPRLLVHFLFWRPGELDLLFDAFCGEEAMHEQNMLENELMWLCMLISYMFFLKLEPT